MTDKTYTISQGGKEIPGLTREKVIQDAMDERYKPGDYIKGPGIKQWKPLSEVEWIPIRGKYRGEIKQERISKVRRKRLILCLSLLTLAIGLLLLSRLFNQSVGTPGARVYLTQELDAWRAGRETDAYKAPFSFSAGQPILVDYEIVEEMESDASYLFTVQLTFSTMAGGRPVELHQYRVIHGSKSWEITNPKR